MEWCKINFKVLHQKMERSLTLRNLWSGVENLINSHIEQSINRYKSTFEMISQNNVLDWDIGFIVSSIFRFFVIDNSIFSFIFFVFLVSFLYIVSILLDFIFRYFKISKLNKVLHQKFGNTFGMIFVFMFWCLCLYALYNILYLLLP